MGVSRNVLLVDGNAELREATGDLLAALGWRVIAVPRADEALRFLESGGEAVDLIVADVPLAVAGVTEPIRELASRGGGRVVLIASAAEEPALRRALSPQRPSLVRKPFSALDLGRAVEQALAGGPRPPAPAVRQSPPPPSPAARRWRLPAWTAAPASLAAVAAGLAAVAAGLVLWGAEPALPSLPEPAAQEAKRGAPLDLVEPRGEVGDVPTSLRFQEIAGAASYEVRILAVDDRVLWQGEGAASPVVLPPEAREVVHAGVVYYWRVEALDAAGEAMAISQPARFRVTAGQEGGPEEEERD